MGLCVYHRLLPESLSNCYLVYHESNGSAVLVNPGSFDVSLLRAVESRKLTVDAVLITNSREKHTGGIPTVYRVYNPPVYLARPEDAPWRGVMVEDGTDFTVGALEVHTVAVPSLSMDSMLYVIENVAFVGDLLGAGTIFEDVDAFGRDYLVRQIRERVLPLHADTVILPSHGPPTTVGIEAQTNPFLQQEHP